MMKRFTTTVLAATLLAAPAFSEGEKAPVEPFLVPLGDSHSLTSGDEIYTYWCAACHAMGKPGAVAVMMLRGTEIPLDLADTPDLDVDYVRYLVRNGQAAMPHFRKTQISDEQLDALAEYLAEPSQ